MTPAELNYDIHDKKLFTIVAAFQTWRVYMKEVLEITVFIDHKNLVNFYTTKKLNRYQIRWSELLSSYKFRIEYRPSKDNGRADALSQRSDIIDGQKDRSHSILWQNKDDSLSPNSNILATTVTIESEIEQRLKKICQKNKISKILLKKKSELIISEIKRQLYVFWSLWHWIIHQYHNDSAQRHPGILKTVELLSRNYYFPGIRKKVEQYINKCQNYQLNKHITHVSYKYIQYAKIADYLWQNITMDFIVKFLKLEDSATGTKYNSILVIVDKLTKYAHLIPYNEEFTAKQTAWIVLNRIIWHHGIPEIITLDRDRIFTSNFWQTLMAEIRTKLKLSIVYHPQTDGQTKRTNQTLKIYLRHYINHSQKNWIQLLSMAQLILNNRTVTATEESAFYTNFDRHPNLFNTLRKSPQATAALQEASQLRNIYKEISKNIKY